MGKPPKHKLTKASQWGYLFFDHGGEGYVYRPSRFHAALSLREAFQLLREEVARCQEGDATRSIPSHLLDPIGGRYHASRRRIYLINPLVLTPSQAKESLVAGTLTGHTPGVVTGFLIYDCRCYRLNPRDWKRVVRRFGKKVVI